MGRTAFSRGCRVSSHDHDDTTPPLIWLWPLLAPHGLLVAVDLARAGGGGDHHIIGAGAGQGLAHHDREGPLTLVGGDGELAALDAGLDIDLATARSLMVAAGQGG